MFSLTTSIAGLIAQPLILNQAATFGSIPMLLGICSFVGFFTFVTPALLHIITKRYVIEMEYNKNIGTYHAHVLTFFLRRKIVSIPI